MKQCATCGRAFRPSSNHRDCPSCRSKATLPRVRRADAETLDHVRNLPGGARTAETPPAGDSCVQERDAAQVLGAGLRLRRDAGPPARRAQSGIRVRAHRRHGGVPRALSVPGENVHHPQRHQGRQPSGKSRAMGQTAADRVSGGGGCRVGRGQILARYARQPTGGGGLPSWVEVGAIECPVQSESSLDLLQA